MLKFSVITLSAAVLCFSSLADPLLDQNYEYELHQEFVRITNLPENKIDIGIASLTFAKEFYPQIDIAEYSRRIDAVAAEVLLMANGTKDPETRIRVLNSVFFRRHDIYYDRDPFARTKMENYFINGIMDRNQGNCYTMPLLYIAIAQRAGYPIYPVIVPDHMFARYVDPSFKEQNIEVTSGGKYFEDSWYIEDFTISRTGIESGAYLRTLTYKEFVGDIIGASAYAWGLKKEFNRSRVYLENEIKLYPKCAECYRELSEGYQAWSKSSKGEWVEKFSAISKQYATKVKELGYVDPSTIRAERRLRGK